jgi:putative flippase GtrA
MKRLLHKRSAAELLRFAVVGGIATVLQVGIYYLLSAHINHNLALPVSYGLALMANFLLTTYFTFRVKPSKKRGVGFLLSHANNFVLQFLLLNFFIEVAGLDKQLAIIPVLAICIPINFLLIRFFMKK